jgi:carboxypeptidase PM20D1
VDDPMVQVRLVDGSEPSPVSPPSGPGWDLITAALAEIVPDAIPTPYTQTGATDSRRFTTICDRVYRFTPFDLTTAERGALHAVDERIRVGSWLRGIEVYRAIVTRL